MIGSPQLDANTNDCQIKTNKWTAKKDRETLYIQYIYSIEGHKVLEVQNEKNYLVN